VAIVGVGAGISGDLLARKPGRGGERKKVGGAEEKMLTCSPADSKGRRKAPTRPLLRIRQLTCSDPGGYHA
jgi:hypothetical protein